MKSTIKNQKSYNSNSFLLKIQFVLVLLGLLPFLIVVYLFYYGNIDITGTIVTFSALALFSILTGFTLLRNSSDQLIDLSKKTSIAKNGDRNDSIKITADQELIDIAENFNVMLQKVDGIDREIKEQSVQLMKYARDLSKSYETFKKEEKLRSRLGRYVGEDLVEKLINSKEGALLENERKEVTVLFADIRSFTTIAESMDAQDVMAMLNEFFGVMVDIVFKNYGVLDKFLGDQLMAVFGPLQSENNAAYDAVKVAIEMQAATEALMKVRGKQDKVTFDIGIGINTGSSIVGNLGAEKRMDYTVIGDSVNVAARLQQMAKSGEIIIGENTHHQIQGRFRAAKKGEISVKGKVEPVMCYNVIR
jgi:adenylate cyclase